MNESVKTPGTAVPQTAPKIILEAIRESHLPTRMTPGAIGYDVKANLTHEVTLGKGDWALIPCGFKVELPKNVEMQVRGRSGNAKNIGVFAHLGTVDPDYRGEVGIILFNLGATFVIKDGDRIGQVVFNQVSDLMTTAGKVNETARGTNGFGSTGK